MILVLPSRLATHAIDVVAGLALPADPSFEGSPCTIAHVVADNDDDDGEDEVESPRVRRVRVVVAGVLGVVGAVGALMSWFVIHPSHPPPEPQGSAAAVGQSVAPVVAWSSLVVCGLVAVVSAIALAIALREGQVARASRSIGRTPPVEADGSKQT